MRGTRRVRERGNESEWVGGRISDRESKVGLSRTSNVHIQSEHPASFSIVVELCQTLTLAGISFSDSELNSYVPGSGMSRPLVGSLSCVHYPGNTSRQFKVRI